MVNTFIKEISLIYLIIITTIFIRRCQDAGSLHEDIVFYKQQLKNCSLAIEDFKTHNLDMGIKALR